MSDQQFADQQRLSEILKLARMQLNDEYMKQHAAAHAAWITGARAAWTTTGTLLPFTTKFAYPTEEEVVARGVEIYNKLTPNKATAVPVAPAVVESLPVESAPAQISARPEVEILQAGGDFVLAETETECTDDTGADITDVVAKEETATAPEPAVSDALLENRFKSLFTKWGGRGNY
jgi:hypothetical protein